MFSRDEYLLHVDVLVPELDRGGRVSILGDLHIQLLLILIKAMKGNQKSRFSSRSVQKSFAQLDRLILKHMPSQKPLFLSEKEAQVLVDK